MVLLALSWLSVPAPAQSFLPLVLFHPWFVWIPSILKKNPNKGPKGKANVAVFRVIRRSSKIVSLETEFLEAKKITDILSLYSNNIVCVFVLLF